MHADIGRAFAGIAFVACAATGCGIAPFGSDSSPPDAVGVLFAEDADPALARQPFVRDELLIQPLPGGNAGDLDRLIDGVGAKVADKLPAIDMTVLRVPRDRFLAIASKLTDSGLLETVQKNYRFQPGAVPDDPLFLRQPHLLRIGLQQAWDVTVGDPAVIVAVVDTGVDTSHPDLSGRIVDGWNVVDGNRDFRDVLGHGTAVAGVVAASTDNALGVAGVTWRNPLLAIRATDTTGAASSRDIAVGILWATRHRARVINVSFAPLWSNRIVRSAVREAFNRGSLVVISAGNAGGFTKARGYGEALFVGGIDSADRLAPFSDRGPFVDLVAPGVDIRSTRIGGGFGVTTGTSFAAPIVSGVAALVWSVNLDLRPVSVREVLLSTTVDLGAAGKDTLYGYGAVDASAAVRRASRISPTPDATPPAITIEAPLDGAALTGRSVAQVSTHDRGRVADVVMSIDGVPYATDTREPFRFLIDTARLSPGLHELAFVATDVSGNASAPKSVSIRTGAPKDGSRGTGSTITFHAPRAGAVVSGNVLLEATVANRVGLATIEWFVDGESLLVSTAAGRSVGASLLWRTAGVRAGRHTITLLATDSRGGQTIGRLDLATD